QRLGGGGGGRGGTQGGSRAGARAWQRRVRPRRRGVRLARPVRGRRPQRGDRRDPQRARNGGQALGLDDGGECARSFVTRARVCTEDGEWLVDRRRLVPRRDTR